MRRRVGLHHGLLRPTVHALGMAGLLATLAACRPGEGERCYCFNECRGGLVCAAAGAVLLDGQCVQDVTNDLQSGECVDEGNAPKGDTGVKPPPYFDLGTHAPGYEESGAPASSEASGSDSMGTTETATGTGTGSTASGSSDTASSTGEASESTASATR